MRRVVGDLDLRVARSAEPRGPAHGAAAQGRDSGGRRRPRVGGSRCTPCARPVGPRGGAWLRRGRGLRHRFPRRPLGEAGARGPSTGRGAAMGPPGPWRGAAQAPAQNQD
ncbi:hypothetical protein NN561_014932 [Cricetulus griseus]